MPKSRFTRVKVAGWLVPAECPWFTTQLLLTRGEMDKDVIECAIEAAEDHDVAIDVGAHIGIWTRRLAEVFNRVEAFEPNSEMHEFFEANVSAQNVVLREVALGKRSSQTRLEFGVNSGQTHIAKGKGVKVVSLDAIPAPGKISLIKIDAEGMDADVVKGAEETIKRHRPVVVIEENICARRYGFAIREARSILESFGMKTKKKIGDNVVLSWH